jgi:plasmid stability protein
MSKTIQIRDVSERTHATLRSRAAAAGMSLSDYLRKEIDEIASRPEVSEVLRRAEQRTGRVSGADIVAAVRAGRDRDEPA